MSTMAVRNESPGANASRAWLMGLALVALFAVALFLRAYWNLDAATEGGNFILSGGPDPYYHKRAVDAIQERGFTTLTDDPLLNYPYGSVNPNPPLFQWTMAVTGLLMKGFFGGDLATSTWQAVLWTAPVFGALTVFPIYFLGKAVFDSRRVGLVAALLWTVSTAAIDTAGIGAADHDPVVMFFATLAFTFYAYAAREFRGQGNWVSRWNDGSAVAKGLGNLVRDRRAGFMYALLAGISIAAVGLTWKGFPYVIGIIGIYAAIQLFIDHWRNRDSTGLFTATFLALLVGTLLAYPYYTLTGTTNFVTPVWYALAAFAVWGLVLVPTRDLPTLLVIPAALVALGLLLAGAFVVFPEVARSLFYSTIYLKRTALYATIGEAHPASFSNLAFGIGPAVFLIGVAAWFGVAWLAIRQRPARPLLFGLVWAALAFYFATSAIRFLFNAIPVFALFAAFGIVWVMEWLDFGAIRRALAGNRSMGGLRKGLRPMHVVGVVLAVLLLVLPNAMLAADAALPYASEQKISDEAQSGFVKSFVDKRMGAYGQSFVDQYWIDSLGWLDEYDAHIAKVEDRPAFLAWWDYGHWAITIGKHPTVADPFQNAYEFAANFLLSQNETHSVQLMAARLTPLADRAEAEALLTAAGATDAKAAYDQLVSWKYVDQLDLEQSVAYLDAIEKETGKSIRYIATDIRMMPFDDPQTQGIDQSSIFPAPVTLKGDDVDAYLPVKINTGGGIFLTQKQFEEEIRKNPTRQIGATEERMEFTPKFYNSMFYRSFIGTPIQSQGQTVTGDEIIQAINTQQPAIGMTHFRVVYATPQVKIVEYTPGAIVTGTVTEEGTPIGDATVTVYDDAGSILLENIYPQAKGRFNASDFIVAHASSFTDENGAYSVIAPFSMEGGNITVVARKGGVELARNNVVISRQAAQARETFTADLTVLKGSVEGTVFEDKDGNGAYDAATDQTIANVTVTVGGVTTTTDAAGHYALAGVSAGRQNVTVDAPTYEVAEAARFAQVQPGTSTPHDIALDLKPGTVKGLVWADVNDDNVTDQGEGAGFAQVEFTADTTVSPNAAKDQTLLADSSGNYTIDLAPGSYVMKVTFTGPDGTEYSGTQNVVVASTETLTVDLRLAKSA